MIEQNNNKKSYVKNDKETAPRIAKLKLKFDEELTKLPLSREVKPCSKIHGRYYRQIHDKTNLLDGVYIFEIFYLIENPNPSVNTLNEFDNISIEAPENFDENDFQNLISITSNHPDKMIYIKSNQNDGTTLNLYPGIRTISFFNSIQSIN